MEVKIFWYFQNNVLKYVIRLKPNSFFNCCNLKDIRLTTRRCLELRIYLSKNLRKIFQHSLNPLCSCGSNFESSYHVLLYCLYCFIFSDKMHTLMSTLNNIDCKILESTDSCLTQTFSYCCTSCYKETKTLVFNATINYILSTERFKELLFQKKSLFFNMQCFNPNPFKFYVAFDIYFVFVGTLRLSLSLYIYIYIYTYIYYINIYIYIYIYMDSTQHQCSKTTLVKSYHKVTQILHCSSFLMCYL